jgi:hypothetical protein
MTIIMFDDDGNVAVNANGQKYSSDVSDIELETFVESVKTEEGHAPGVSLQILKVDEVILMSTSEKPSRLSLSGVSVYVFNA